MPLRDRETPIAMGHQLHTFADLGKLSSDSTTTANDCAWRQARDRAPIAALLQQPWAGGEMEERVRMIQLWLTAPCIKEINLVQL